MRKFLLTCFIFLTGIAFGQTFLYNFQKDSILKENAKNYLNASLGVDFVSKNLDFVLLTNAGLDVVIYQTKAKDRPDGKNTVFVYFKYLKLEVDSQRSIYNKKEILKSIKGKACNLLIGMGKAKEIAKKAGLSDGIKKWEIGVIHLATNQIPKWAISSTTQSSRSGARGENINISMIDGTFEQSQFIVQP